MKRVIPIILVILAILVMGGVWMQSKSIEEKQKITSIVEQYLELEQGKDIDVSPELESVKREVERGFAKEDDLYEIISDREQLELEVRYLSLDIEASVLGENLVNTEEGTPEYDELEAQLLEVRRELEGLGVDETNIEYQVDISSSLEDIDPRVVETSLGYAIRYGDLEISENSPDRVAHKGMTEDIRYEDLPKETKEMRMNNPRYRYEVVDVEKVSKGAYSVKVVNIETKVIKIVNVLQTNEGIEIDAKL